jgi:hypothetical protein
MPVFPSFLTVETVKVAYEFTALNDLDRGIGLDWYWPTTLKAKRIWFRETAGTINVHNEPYCY